VGHRSVGVGRNRRSGDGRFKPLHGPAQGGGHLAGAAEAISRLFGQRLEQDSLNRFGNVGIHLAGERNGVGDVLDDHSHRGFSFIGNPASQHFKEHNAQRIDIGAGIHR
jgi:hypothetical protein